MAEKLSIKIALDGGAEIEKQLEGIGAAGQKAFADISKSAEQVGFKNIKPEEVTAKLQEMGVTGVDAINKIQKAVQAAGRLEGIVQGITNVETALAALARAAPVVGVAIVGAVTAAAKATIAFAETLSKTSDEAAKLGLTLEKFQQGKKFFEDLGISSATAADGVRAMSKAAQAANFDKVRQAAAELQDFDKRGFGVQGTAQLKILEQAAKGAGEQANFARKALQDLGQPIPTDGAKTLEQFKTELGSSEAGMAAFKAQLQQMPPGLDRLNVAIDSMGEKAGTALVQSIRAANGEMGAAERKAYDLAVAFDQLSTESGKFGSVTFAPAITNGLNLITNALQTLREAVDNFSWQTFSDAAVAAFNLISSAISNFTLQGMIAQIDTAILKWTGLFDLISKGFANLKAMQAPGAPLPPPGGIPMASGGLLGGRGTGTSDSNLAWVSRGEHIMPARVVRQPGVLGLLESLRRGGGIPGFAAGGAVGDSTPNSVIGPIFNRVIQLLRDVDQAIFDTMSQFLQTVGRLDQSMARIQDTIRQAADELQKLTKASGSARGGLLGGRGSGTSDSNLAWVSRGEYITPARAVAQPGVLAFLEALRRSGGNLGRVLDGMGRFALGGMVPRMPAFAAGGLAGGMSNVTIQFPGLPAIGGLRASSDVVDQLHRAAALAQVRSGGRKPSRYS